jgi:hypothetical protein
MGTTPDCFDASVEHVARRGREACEGIARAVRHIEAGRDARGTGAALPEVVETLMTGGGRDERLAVAESFHDFERALASLRACIVRTLVAEYGLTFTQIAGMLRVSRQAVGRLYRLSDGAGIRLAGDGEE